MLVKIKKDWHPGSSRIRCGVVWTQTVKLLATFCLAEVKYGLAVANRSIALEG